MASYPSNSTTPTPGNNPPYPSTPPDENGFRHAYANSGKQPQKPPTSYHAVEDDIDDWEKDDDEDEEWENVPKPLGTSHKDNSMSTLPESLRIGPPTGVPMRHGVSDNSLTVASQISLPISDLSSTVSLPLQPAPITPIQSHNPFLRKPINAGTGQTFFGGEESNTNHWGNKATSPLSYMQPPPVELPTSHTPTEELSGMNLGTKSSPSQEAPIPVHTEINSQSPDVVNNRPNRNDSVASSQYNPGMDISFMDAASSRGHRLSDTAETPQTRTWDEQKEWEKQQREKREREAEQALQRAQKAEQLRIAEEEFYRGEAEHRAQETQTLPPPPPPRSQPAESASNQRNSRSTPEHYSIKQIRWYDTSAGELRTSPILTQNANGPCPLLALVNALVLSTPLTEPSGLIDALRTREQVSLSLLLDAVFDELMTGRRGSGNQQLPDVAELYDFLKALHTGMNVNPRFVQGVAERSHAPRSAPGGFEETKEMRLYSTFGIQLVHGWLPVLESPEYRAFARSAATYEDAQNVQFHEEELEDRLGTVGLSAREQDLFEDLHTIKLFLQSWPTQLTEYGLQTLHEHLEPGSFAILFRNDHFSTLYKDPRGKQLMTLVTDAGYATHDEIVWESLLDVNGSDAELFSGDFRPVSHSNASSGRGPGAGPRDSSLSQQGQNIQSMLDVGSSTGEWTTVTGLRRTASTSNQGASNNPSNNPFSSLSEGDPHSRTRAEQEDHDLALALQLQEEEEERVRQREADRQREDRLSSQLLDGAGAGTGRGRGRGAVNIPISQAGRPTIPPRRPQGRGVNRPADGSGDPPPPSYEQAASRPAFVPPEGHPANPLAPLPGVGGAPPPGLAPPGGYRPSSSSTPGAGRGGYGVGRGGMMAGGRDDRDKCVVM